MEERRSNPYCDAHGEYMKATAELTTSVAQLTTVVGIVINLAKGLFALGVAMIVTIAVGIFEAGKLYETVQNHSVKIEQLADEIGRHKENAHGQKATMGFDEGRK